MNPEISVIATIYNDNENVRILVNQIIEEVKKISTSYEVILVNDGSKDTSLMEIKAICNEVKEVKAIDLARNYGQQIAASAGLRFSKGDCVILMDGDLENPVSAIPILYNKIKGSELDVIYTVSNVRQSLAKKVTSHLFWFVVGRILKVNVVENQLFMRIFSKRMVKHFNEFEEVSRSIAGINLDIGLNYDVVEVIPNKRTYGKSNYGFFKRLDVFIDIVLNLSSRPLNIIIFLGVITFVFTLLGSGLHLYRHLTGEVLPGFTSIILTNFFFGSVIVLTLGIMSRYLSLIYMEVRNRPLFIVNKTYNL